MFAIKNKTLMFLLIISMTEIKNKQKVTRKIIKIDEDLCTGCGQCVIACAEGALKIIDGKAKIVSEIYCDGLGACIGECPEGALTIEERESFEFDEEVTEEYLRIIKKEVLIETPHVTHGYSAHTQQCSCPSASTIVYDNVWEESDVSGEIPSALRQWPTKLTLVNPSAPFFNNKELLFVSDCAPFAFGDFHRKLLKGKPIVTVCPMLSFSETELEKFEQILNLNPIEKINFILMDVPCCQKIKLFLDPIFSKINRKITIEETIIGRDGNILRQGKI